jgi:protein-disulfide isomerase
VFFAVTIAITTPVLAQQSDAQVKALKAEIKALKAGQAAIREDLAEIRKLLAQSQPVRRESVIESVVLTMALGGSPSRGSPAARVALVEFSDFECPYCRKHMSATLPQIEKEFVETGKIRYFVRDFPIHSIHPYAFKAAEAVNCAGDQGKYWKMREQLFSSVVKLTPEYLVSSAEAIKLDRLQFENCMGSGKHVARIRKDIADGGKAGVTATPIFFLGVADGAEIKIVRRIRGAHPYSVFKTVIDDLLKSNSTN